VIVLDASALTMMLADDTESGRTARSVASRLGQWAAPDIVDIETTSALRRMWLKGRLDDDRFRQALDDLHDLEITRYPTHRLVDRAFELRFNVSPYDACYVGLAEALECPLVTYDARLSAAAGIRCAVTVIGSHHVAAPVGVSERG